MATEYKYHFILTKPYEVQRKAEYTARLFESEMAAIFHNRKMTWSAEARPLYARYLIEFESIAYFHSRSMSEAERKADAEATFAKVMNLLRKLEIQSDRVYLESERMLDTRIDCSIAAG